MALMDYIQEAFEKILPRPKPGIPRPISTSASGGIGSGRGMASFEDDMIVSKPAIVAHTGQIFFNFLAMACFASAASFQAKWGVGPSGLSGFAIFITVIGMLVSAFMVFVPVVAEKYDKFTRLARILRELRVTFILAGGGTVISLLIAFIVTISAWTEPGCKDPNKDPHASKGDDFKKGLDGFCSTKKAGAIFLWLAFGFWLASLGLAIYDWRMGKTIIRPQDPPFNPPVQHHNDREEEEEEEDEESTYEHIPPVRNDNRYTDNSNSPNSPFSDPRYPASSTSPSGAPVLPPLFNSSSGAGGGSGAVSRPSMDAYGAFSDPPPSGFSGSPVISRTMQYADPYAAIRATVATGGRPTSTGPRSPGAQSGPPSYEYTGYR